MSMVRVSESNLAAYLVVEMFRITGTSREGPRLSFHFDDTPALRDAVAEFRFGEALVPARDFVLAQRRLKGLIFDSTLDGGRS